MIEDKALTILEANFTKRYIEKLGYCFVCRQCKAVFISPKDALRHLRWHKRVIMVDVE